MNKTYYLSYTAQQLIKENAACRAEGKTANNVILLSIALTAQREACSLLSLYLCYISSKQCFEDMRFFKFSLHCQYAASPSTKKGVVIYKQVVAFELAQSFFFRKKSPCGGWHPFFEKKRSVLYNVYCTLKCSLPVFVLYHGNIPCDKWWFLQRLNT